jgi:mannose-6-phosphate isomerase-like protein (cupin superfamily)
MQGYVADIEKATLDNTAFRRVLYTAKELQLVAMAISPGEEIGEEVHDDVSQFFRFESGAGEVWIDGVCHRVKADDAVVVPAGALHNVKAIGLEPLKLYTIYSPPEHIDGTVHQTRAEAETAHEHFDGRTSE